jgi:hypothetical protein
MVMAGIIGITAKIGISRGIGIGSSHPNFKSTTCVISKILSLSQCL